MNMSHGWLVVPFAPPLFPLSTSNLNGHVDCLSGSTFVQKSYTNAEVLVFCCTFWLLSESYCQFNRSPPSVKGGGLQHLVSSQVQLIKASKPNQTDSSAAIT